jgi:hypothetical protein
MYKRLFRKRIKLEYTRLARLVKTTQLNITMTKESVHRKILGKRVSNHVARSTVHEDKFTSGDTFKESI